MKILFVTILSFLILCIGTGVTYAQDNSASPQNTGQQVQPIETQKVSGTVSRINGNSMVIMTGTGEQMVTVPPNIKITRNTISTGVSSIKPNDRVTVTQSADGSVLSVDAVAGSVIDAGKSIVPMVLAGILLLLLVIWILRRSQKGKIRTETA